MATTLKITNPDGSVEVDSQVSDSKALTLMQRAVRKGQHVSAHGDAYPKLKREAEKAKRAADRKARADAKKAAAKTKPAAKKPRKTNKAA